jgi:murein DD-endopeptidase MepM/ murein hydrolase activator NlpD
MRRKLFLGALAAGLLATGFAPGVLPALAGEPTRTPVDPTTTTPQTVTTTPAPTPTATTPAVPTPAPKKKAAPKKKVAPKKNKTKKKSKNSPGEFLKEGKAKDKAKRKKDKQKKAKDKAAKDKADKNAAADPLGLGAAPEGVPNFVINRFRIPPFLLPIYQAAGSQYGIRWEVLAAINEIETDYGRNLNVSSAGALGWMQFMPSSWAAYGVDANEDGVKDPYNPVDAIFASARYLKAAGGDKNLRQAIFAYNHANWYVDSVLMRARLVAGMPADLVGSLTGLTQGHFPVYATSHYEGNLSAREARRLGRRTNESHNAAKIVGENSNRRSINIYAREDAPVIAVNDGIVKDVGQNKRNGQFIVLQDIYGNRFTYAHLARLSKTHPVPRSLDDSGSRDEFHAARSNAKADGKAQAEPVKLSKPTVAATAGRPSKVGERSAYKPVEANDAASSETGKERLFANPARAGNRSLAADAGQSIDGADSEEFKVYFSSVLKLSPKEMKLKPLKKGSKVIAGTVLGHIGTLQSGPGSTSEAHLNFSIQPAGRRAPRIDPKPILDGWKLLEATALYRAAGKNPFVGPQAGRPSPGQALLMSKEVLQQRVLNDPYVEVYECGANDIRTGQVDKRVLGLLEFLAASGLHPTVSSLSCGHSFLTAAGGVSDHPFGRAVDIAAINGTPIYGHQGPGTITETTLRKLMSLQGTSRPYQLISLMSLGGPSFALGDHYDHIHVGFPSQGGTPNEKLGKQAQAVLSANQWDKFVSRLTNIENPTVPTTPSKYSVKVKHKRRHGRNRDGG